MSIKISLRTIAQIKDAVDSGKTVKCGGGGYTVTATKGQYYISYDHSDYCIGLHGQEGTEYADKLNGKDFYYMHERTDSDPAAVNLGGFIAGYIECAIWLLRDDEGEPLDHAYDDSDLSEEALGALQEDCEEFINGNLDVLGSVIEVFDYNVYQAGNDFFLTRNGHGAGFWDRGLGEAGDALSEAARVYGTSELYVGDDELLYFGG